MNYKLILSTLALSGLLTACGGGSTSSHVGQLSLSITDGPVENATEVWISFSSVELQGAENTLIEFDEAIQLNLLDLQGDESSVLLDNESLQAGDYQWIRLGINSGINETYIVVNDNHHLLEIPSSAQSGLKINRGFTIGVGTTSDFTIDFDLRKSVTQASNGDFKLRPTLRMVDNLEVTSVNGTVAEPLISDENCNNGDNNDTGNAVYLFAEHDAAVQDIQGIDGDPIASASVKYNDKTEQYEFQIGYIPFGKYTIAFTCDAINDVSDEDNSPDNTDGNDIVVFNEADDIIVASDDDEPVIID